MTARTTGLSEDARPAQQTARPSRWNCIVRAATSQTMGPRVPNHCVPRTRSKPAKGMTKRSTWNVSPCTLIGASRMTPGQVTRSPLATVAVSLWARLDVHPGAVRCTLADEVVRGSRVEEGDQHCGPEERSDL